MERRATVARIEGGFALLKLDAEGGGCGRCGEVGGCSTAVLSHLGSAACRLQRVRNDQSLKVGEAVLLESPPGVLWRAALLMYGLPWLLGVAGALCAQSVMPGQADGAAAAGFAVGLLLGVAAVAWRVKSAGWQAAGARVQRAENSSRG